MLLARFCLAFPSVSSNPLGPYCRYHRYSLFKSRGLSLSPAAVHSMKSSHAFLISSCLFTAASGAGHLASRSMCTISFLLGLSTLSILALQSLIRFTIL
ncbi:polyprotein [Frankliniella fusca]|uniref:Polyprotein n=1 Tax=Frankliniella fusca TaxID=407009 RepID=A0AAE1HJ93_9NEOP|nr:polyprotein [Frankliniella fusca]